MVCKNGSSVRIDTCFRTRFCTFGTDLYARSRLINDISVSDLSWKFIKSALLVGQVQFWGSERTREVSFLRLKTLEGEERKREREKKLFS